MLKNLHLRINRYHILPLFILVVFVLWFAYDIYTFKKYFAHPDFRLYYSFRQWFSQRLLNGEFPLWNPYWGIGQPAVVWTTIPIDIYTILEIIFGPQYHYFQTIQLAFILLAGFYTFVKLGFSTMVSATGILLFFMTPWVTYFYFYFMNPHSFIANMLLFLFVYQWFKTGDRKYIFFIIWTTIFSMFGTKPEHWFYQITFYIFFSITAGLLFYSGKAIRSIKMLLLAILAMGIGVIAHLWQLNILIRIMRTADRIGENSINNLFAWEMYHNLFMSIAESELLIMLGVGFLFYLGVTLKRRFSWVFLFLGVLVTAYFAMKWHISFIKSPVFYGTILGIILSRIFIRGFTWKDYAKSGFIFLLLIYYWCRSGRGDLGEMEVIRSSPSAFKILLTALVWTGCMQFWRNKLAKLAYFSVVFIFLMRDHGQIILAYLTGLLWIPTRDNYIIDFAVSVIAVIGLTSLELRLPNVLINKPNWCKWWIRISPIPIVSMGVIVLSASSDFYYSHPMMQDTPPGYPYYTGVPKLSEVIRELHDSPTTRIFLVNDDAWGFTYGMGSSLLEGVGQVTQYDSLVPKNYKDWTVYRRIGIRPEEGWGGYPNGYTGRTIAKLPKRNMAGYSNSEIYSYTLMLRPPVEKSALQLLGVKYIVGLSLLSDQKIKELTLDDIREQGGVSYPGIDGSLVTARLNNPLPRAFLVSGVSDEKLDEFKKEMNPIITDNTIKTKSFEFSFSHSHIERYEPENISIVTEAEEESYLVLSDLYYPFWHARIDGKNANVFPAFYMFRALKVPQGKHIVDFCCTIPYFKTSVSISMLTIFLCMLATVFYFWRSGNI